MPIWLISGLLSARKAASSALTWATANTAHLLLIALAITALWGVYERHEAGKYHRAADSCSAARKLDLKAYTDAQTAALAKAQAAKAATEQNYRNLANKVDTDAKQAHDSAMADAERYIAAHRMRGQAVAGSASGTVAGTQDHGAGNGQAAGSAALVDEVGVSPDDIRICTTNTLQAEAARTWALQLEAAH